jgi:hypothetical protein
VEDECIGTKLEFSVYNVAIQGVNTIIDPADDAASSPHLPDTLIEELRAEAAADPQNADLIAVFETEFPTNRTHTPPHVRRYWSIREQLSTDGDIVLYGSRLVIPSDSCCGILAKLHSLHKEIVRTKRRAQQTVYWPRISNDIMMLDICQERLPSQAQEPLLADPLPSYVFEDVSADLFQQLSLHLLVYADRLSGWLVVH